MDYKESKLALEKFVKLKTTQRPAFMDAVLKAIDKQIPKAPIPAQDKVVWTIFEFCPTCGVSITGSHLPHCYNCGQKIDWDNVD